MHDIEWGADSFYREGPFARHAIQQMRVTLQSIYDARANGPMPLSAQEAQRLGTDLQTLIEAGDVLAENRAEVASNIGHAVMMAAFLVAMGPAAGAVKAKELTQRSASIMIWIFVSSQSNVSAAVIFNVTLVPFSA